MAKDWSTEHVTGGKDRDTQSSEGRRNCVIGRDQREQRRNDEQVATNDEHGEPADYQLI
jgi:hypothetical protein